MDKLTFYRENILIAEVEFSKDPDELVFVNMYKPLTLEENKTIIEELKKRGFNFSKGESND